MKKTKIRRPRINSEVYKAISDLYLENPDWTGKQMWVGLGYYSEGKWPVPSLRAVQKIFADIKAKTKTPEFQRKEADWNMATLDEHPLPSEAIPMILEIQARDTHFGKFSIRQAIWISRIFRVISDLELLDDISWYYTLHEKICQLSGTPFDTSKYDNLLNDPKQLIKAFEAESPQTKDNFQAHKTAFEAITNYTLNEPSFLVQFKGNEAWAKRKYKPDVLLGSRDKIIEEFKKIGKFVIHLLDEEGQPLSSTRYRKKSTQIPDGDFAISPVDKDGYPIPVTWHKGLEEHSNKEHDENNITE